MFNMNKVGLRLVDLRKKFDFTQVEVADKLGVSYQAVSNWERGLSMPDISKLPEIAELYDVSLDKLLGKHRVTGIVESISSETFKEYSENNDITLKDVEEVSSFVKPSQLDELANTAPIEDVTEDMLGMLPFVSREAADKIVYNLLDKVKTIDLINQSIPFLSKNLTSELIKRGVQSGEKASSFIECAPFIEKEYCNELALKAFDEGYSCSELLDSLAPFVSKVVLSTIAKKAMESMKVEDVLEYAPFLTRELMSELIDELLLKSEVSIDVFESIAPFIGRETADKIVLKAIENGEDVRKYIEYAPFISRKVNSLIIENL